MDLLEIAWRTEGWRTFFFFFFQVFRWCLRRTKNEFFLISTTFFSAKPTHRNQSNSIFLPRRPFSFSSHIVGRDPLRKSVRIERRSRGMVQISIPTVSDAKSDVQVGLGKVVPRFIMLGHTFIRSSNIDFQKIGSHSTFERAIQNHCGKVNLSRSR